MMRSPDFDTKRTTSQMADRTARVVVGRAIFVSAWSGTSVPRDERGHAWDRIMSDGLRSPWTSQADAVLAALGIDPDTPTDDVKAALLLLRNPTWRAEQDYRDGHWFAYDLERMEEPAGIGGSRAAAVLALGERLRLEATDG
jgi:hypothetical protein